MISHGLMVGGQVAVKLLETGDTPSTSTLTTMLSSTGEVFSSIMDWTTDVLDLIASNPMLLLFVVGSFALIAVGVVKRLLRL